MILPRNDANIARLAGRDGFFIHVKLHRALDGRDRAQHGEERDEDPVQNDWNGSAKVALLSIVRGLDAWNTIARFTRDPDAAHIASELQRLRPEVEEEFPNAWRFVRPGFDQDVSRPLTPRRDGRLGIDCARYESVTSSKSRAMR